MGITPYISETTYGSDLNRDLKEGGFLSMFVRHIFSIVCFTCIYKVQTQNTNFVAGESIKSKIDDAIGDKDLDLEVREQNYQNCGNSDKCKREDRDPNSISVANENFGEVKMREKGDHVLKNSGRFRAKSNNTNNKGKYRPKSYEMKNSERSRIKSNEMKNRERYRLKSKEMKNRERNRTKSNEMKNRERYRLKSNEIDDDTDIVYGSRCDQMEKGECWFVREIGDTLTLTVNITSAKGADAFVVRWHKIYYKRSKNKRIALEIQPGRLPWNMIWGANGRELRIDPVTNYDVDPNAIAAKVFEVERKDGRKLFQKKKELKFHIDIPAIDMGNVYSSGQLNINLENFISLPERGKLTFDWTIKQPDGQYLPLPSNFRISPSGRSVVIKELKRAHAGILMAVIYSSRNVAIAKRKFSIEKIGCTGSLEAKMFRRWIRSLFGEPSTEDPKVMLVEKLIALSENSDGTIDDLIPHEIHYVSPKVMLVKDSDGSPVEAHRGFCHCQPEFFGDGFVCFKIPRGSHRDKRIRRQEDEEYDGMVVTQPRSFTTGHSATKKFKDEDLYPKLLAFEDEESALLSICLNRSDCSVHAVCTAPAHGHSYCKCRPGFRGNGIFCWEIIDYVPVEEQKVSEDVLD
ncbi:uncharacterized protein LOC129220768 [Uloborus diversus]|uniref:uncharacterized protein LOC129220768 n=1 Tax=Uloborus diversus TaxID=327109 RepID=UPI002409ECB7|nr:uncharacterized protein LOC129220768 [Uloborus diversus]